jgi:hypothetical protein
MDWYVVEAQNIRYFVKRENYAISREPTNVPVLLKRYGHQDDMEMLVKRSVKISGELSICVLPIGTRSVVRKLETFDVTA